MGGSGDGNAQVVGVFGDSDLNVIDGSTVWLVSICQMLSMAGARVELLAKAPVERTTLVADLVDLEAVTVWQPTDVGIGGRVGTQALPGALAAIDAELGLDIVIVRGFAAASAVVADGRFEHRLWLYLTDIPQTMEAMTDDVVERLLTMFDAAERVLCQTEHFRALLAAVAPEFDAKFILLPPMVPSSAFALDRESVASSVTFLYSGKFAPDWGIEEMISGFTALHDADPSVRLTVAGDKFHQPADDPSYASRVEAALRSDGVEWVGGIDRSGVMALLASTDVAVSVRRPTLDDSLEISTKLLEYSAAGVPTLMNRTAAHVELFGPAYPYFVDSIDDLPQRLADAVAGGPPSVELSAALKTIAAPFEMGVVAQRMDPVLRARSAWRTTGLAGRRIVVAGHDLKFAGELIAGLRRAGAEVRVDTWVAGAEDTPRERHDLLAWADTVVCEWCLGNAVWYASRVRDDQQLVVRFHRTELTSPWPRELRIDRVDQMVFVSDHTRSDALTLFDWPAGTGTVIPNFVDVDAFDRPKLGGATHTLGMLGYLPSLKRMDLALDILEHLRQRDRRFRLEFKGSSPTDLSWVWNDDVEQAYYRDQFERIRMSPLLRDAVVFVPSGGDVPSWLRGIGWILSLSDLESFHLAMVEGMASGAVPVALPREGVGDIVDPRWMARDTRTVSTRISDHADASDYGRLSTEAKNEARARYGLGITATRWLEVIGRHERDGT